MCVRDYEERVKLNCNKIDCNECQNGYFKELKEKLMNKYIIKE